MKNEISGASRTFVISSEDCVVGYYALATGSVMRQQAPGKIKRAMPDPIPVMILGRLAVDRSTQGCGLGVGLLRRKLSSVHITSRNMLACVHCWSMRYRNLLGIFISAMDSFPLHLKQ